jgi:dolichyl-phosphate beta-glucosyltransferase
VRTKGRRARAYAGLAALAYLGLSVFIWSGAWTGGASTHTLCGCGDPALFLWFFQWPATAVAHGQDPFYSTALFHPGGINLLAQTSVPGLSLPLIPITWLFGPVASLNVAVTAVPALTAFFTFLVLRRWVTWLPAAFLGGLLFGFSPFVLANLQFAHLMMAALMLLPLILGLLDEILLRQEHSPRATGALLGALLFAQFFLSSELLAIMAVLMVFCGLVLLGAALVAGGTELRRLAPHALEALAISGVVAAVLLAFPVWFALDGPAHLSGVIWPNIGMVGGYIGSSFVSKNIIPGTNVYTALGGYQGALLLPSSAFLGWGLIAVIVAGLIAWFRDLRLWFYTFLLALCISLSIGVVKGQWEPARVLAKIPVIDNVIEQRFMAVGFLAAAVLLTLLIDKTHAAARRLAPKALTAQGMAVAAGAASAGVALIALLPILVTFGPVVPLTMRPVILPRWYSTVAPTLPPGRVLLSYPVPFSGIQVAMSWQAVNRMSYSQAGGGGPQGTSARAGSARAGFDVLGPLAFGVNNPPPVGTPAQLAAVRHALVVWKVNTVVIAPDATAPMLQQGHNPVYAAAFMTAVLGKLPVIEAGAWVWNDVSVGQRQALRVPPSVIADCTARSERAFHHHHEEATMQVVDCVGLAAIHDG